MCSKKVYFVSASTREAENHIRKFIVSVNENGCCGKMAMKEER